MPCQVLLVAGRCFVCLTIVSRLYKIKERLKLAFNYAVRWSTHLRVSSKKKEDHCHVILIIMGVGEG